MPPLSPLFLTLAMFAVARGQPAPIPAESQPNDVLANWVHEPIAVDGLHYRLLLDRRDGSFVFYDRRGNKKWYSSWGRRGFASVFLKKDDGEPRWVALQKIETQDVQEKKLTFVARPSDDSVELRWVIEAVPNHEGLLFRYEIPEKERQHVLAVRLFDGCLWAGEEEKGAAFLPVGMGERWGMDGAPRAVTLARPALQPSEATADSTKSRAYTMRLVAPEKDSKPVLVCWTEDDVRVKVERKPMAAAGDGGSGFPGKVGLFVSVESTASTAEVRIFALGEVKLGVGDAVRGYRGLLAPETNFSLRFKTGKNRAHRGLIGAAIFRPAIGPQQTFAHVADLARRLRDKLGVDQAAFLLREWSTRSASPASPASPGSSANAFTPRDDAGGEKGALALSRTLEELGFIGGVDLPVTALDSKKPPADGVELWRRRIARVQSSDTLAALKEYCEPRMVVWDFTEPSPAGRRAAFSPAGKNCRLALGRYCEELIGLAGVVRGAEQDLEFSSFFGAAMPPTWRAADGVADWPLFSATFSHCVRLARPAGQPLRSGDAAGVLLHLLLGEVPLYALPHEDPSWKSPAPQPSTVAPEQCFAQLDGWAAGQRRSELTAYEVFLKNTYELLSHVCRYRARTPLMHHQSLTPDRAVKETFFGTDMRIVVNFGDKEYEDEDEGFVLPQYGFYVRYPFLLAFHAKRVHKLDYDRPAFFVVRSLEGKMIYRAERVKIYHGFGPSKIRLAGRDFDVPHETVTKIW